MHCWFCGLMVKIVGKQSGQNSIYSIHIIRQELWKGLNPFLQCNGLKVKPPLATPFRMMTTGRPLTFCRIKSICSSRTLLYLDTGKPDMFLAYATVPGYWKTRYVPRLCYCTWIQVNQICSSLALLYLDTGKPDMFLAYATVPRYT